MNVRRILSFLGIVSAAATPLAAQSASERPSAVVRRLYADVACETVLEEPRCPADRELTSMSRAQLSRYFDRQLVELLLRDRACAVRTREVCRLHFSPVWDSQDPAGRTVRVLPGPSERLVSVELRQPASDAMVRLQVELIQRPGGWRIRDIAKPGAWSLVTLLDSPP